jgi:hypothetical protein
VNAFIVFRAAQCARRRVIEVYEADIDGRTRAA